MIYFLGAFPSAEPEVCRLSVCDADGSHVAAMLAGGRVLAVQLCLKHADALAVWLARPGKVEWVDLFGANDPIDNRMFRARGRMRPKSSRNLVLPANCMKGNHRGLIGGPN